MISESVLLLAGWWGWLCYGVTAHILALWDIAKREALLALAYVRIIQDDK